MTEGKMADRASKSRPPRPPTPPPPPLAQGLDPPLKMPSFRENRTSLPCAFDSGVINEEEFVLLYDINTAKSPDLPYWNYEHFDLDNLADDVCKAEFRFYMYRNDVYN